jgi:hypothetical protein
MDDDEIRKKDWQVLTARILISNAAHLRLILDNQAVIISELKKIPLSKITEQMDKYLDEQEAIHDKIVRERLPDYK